MAVVSTLFAHAQGWSSIKMAAHFAKFQVRRRKSVIFSNLKRYYAGKIGNIYSETINLPKTAFRLRIEHNERRENEAEISNKGQFEGLYRWQRGQKREKEFVLHDGPPYSNGKPHMGHAVNKILKDITNRYKLLRGFKVHYVPGWDCHGLPIELKALQEEMTLKNNDKSPLVIRQKAKKVAEKYSKIQMDAFSRWAVMADWPRSYFTYHKSYISRQLELFLDLYEKGLIYREFKPVYWSPASQTALAEAELEYNNNHKSTSIYVKMDMSESSNAILPSGERGKLHALVWTTTPWTLPANGAVCYAPDQKYCIVRCAKTADLFLIASEAKTRLEQLLSTSLNPIVTFDGTVLRGLTYLHPFDGRELKLLPARHVTMSKGTGLVHSAPLHGPEDYTVALEHRLPLGTCQVDEDGRFTSAYGERLSGKEVLGQGIEEVMDMLRDRIVHRETHLHSYPYDWRTKTPVIFRASLQWFIDTEKIRDTAIRLLEDVRFTPESAKQLMVKQLSSRTYWCVSRQRNWGVPIPVFYDEQTDEPLINRDIINHLQRVVHVHGGDFWWKLNLDELLPAEVRSRCGIAADRNLRAGKDIMDIWFDSGSSWANVLEGDGVADVCIEGEDQLGGWFQSSLLLSAASTGRAPYRALRIHGFTLDGKGRKMSKSLGNVVDPAMIVDGGGTKATPAYGADVLRLWVAQHASGRNAHVKLSVIQQTSEEYQKIRSTFRYLLGVLSNHEVAEVPVDTLHLFDQYMLHLLNRYNIQVMDLYENSQYNKAVTLALNFLTREVSSLYCHVVKDRLYCEDATGSKRRSCQVVIANLLDVMVKSMAPVLPYLAEEVHMHSPVHGKGDASVFHGRWNQCPKSWDHPSLEEMFQSLFEIRKLINQESTSQAANTQEFDVLISSNDNLSSALRKMQPEDVSRFSQLCEFLQVSQITLDQDFAKETSSTNTSNDAKLLLDSEECRLVISTARYHLCPRCRRYTSERMNEPCPRCVQVIAEPYA